jgi:hypothetical protein
MMDELSSHLTNGRDRSRRRLDSAACDLATLSTSVERLVERATQHLEHVARPAGAVDDISVE